ncbi:MAG: hypothetical protein SPL30_04980 [Succinivibrio sp.]|jgi:hypothetical protein|nr:hypothetical protein [Succinivibrio sp.]
MLQAQVTVNQALSLAQCALRQAAASEDPANQAAFAAVLCALRQGEVRQSAGERAPLQPSLSSPSSDAAGALLRLIQSSRSALPEAAEPQDEALRALALLQLSGRAAAGTDGALVQKSAQSPQLPCFAPFLPERAKYLAAARRAVPKRKSFTKRRRESEEKTEQERRERMESFNEAFCA